MKQTLQPRSRAQRPRMPQGQSRQNLRQLLPREPARSRPNSQHSHPAALVFPAGQSYPAGPMSPCLGLAKPGTTGGKCRPGTLVTTETAASPETSISGTLVSLTAPERTETTGHQRGRARSDRATLRRPTDVRQMPRSVMLAHAMPVRVMRVCVMLVCVMLVCAMPVRAMEAHATLARATLAARLIGTGQAGRSPHRDGMIMVRRPIGITVLHGKGLPMARAGPRLDLLGNPRFPRLPGQPSRRVPRKNLQSIPSAPESSTRRGLKF